MKIKYGEINGQLNQIVETIFISSSAYLVQMCGTINYLLFLILHVGSVCGHGGNEPVVLDFET